MTLLEIFLLIILFFIAVGTLGTAYVLQSGFNQTIKGMKAINDNLARIDIRLEVFERKDN